MNDFEINEVIEKSRSGKANVILDATILTSLMSCPRLADFRFNHHLQPLGGKSNSLECGSIVHIFLEYFYKGLIAGVKREQAIGFGMTAAELYIKGCKFCADFTSSEEVTKPLCGHKPDEFPGVHNTPKDSEGHKTGWQYVLDTCDQYQIFYKNDHWISLEVETVKAKVLYEDDEIRILWKSKLDWIVDTNQGIFPVDHKTMKQNRQTNSMNNQFIGQCLMMGTRNVFINKIGFQTTLKPEEKFVRTAISYSAARLLEWQSETLPVWAKHLLMYTEGEHYPPNFTNCEGKYGNCIFYKDVCSGDPSMREENIKLNFMVGKEWNPTNDDE